MSRPIVMLRRLARRVGCALLVSWIGMAQASPTSTALDRAPASGQLRLSPTQQWIPAEQLHAAAAGALTDALAGRVDRLEVSMPRHGAAGVSVAAGTVRLVARDPGPETVLRPRVALWVDVLVSGVVRTSVLVPLELHAFQSAWVAVQDLPAGTRLSRALLRHEEIDLTLAGASAWRGDPEGQVLRTPIRAGRCVPESQVATAPAVARGDRVVLVHRLGAVEVQARADALQDGDPGQHVQVRVDGAHGAVMARVVEAGKVELYR